MKDLIHLDEVVKTVDAKHSVKINSNKALQAFCGALDRNLLILGEEFAVSLVRVRNEITISGEAAKVQRAMPHINLLIQKVESGQMIDPDNLTGLSSVDIHNGSCLYLPKMEVRPRNANQRAWIESLLNNDLSMGQGPAGTGKTMLAVCVGVHLYLSGVVGRLIISRPAVEAGERLGFLPGDMKEKVDPYMQPIYDALNDTMPAKTIQKMLSEKTLEIAPLAFMRGRTLSNAFILLDEAQNTTPMQMKMFLTRLGKGSRMAITGDPKQVDLPKGAASGLAEATQILNGIEGIGMVSFSASDVVRHPLVAKIVSAYEKKEEAA